MTVLSVSLFLIIVLEQLEQVLLEEAVLVFLFSPNLCQHSKLLTPRHSLCLRPHLARSSSLLQAVR